MKRLLVWLTGALYGVLAISGLSFAYHTTPPESKIAKISTITQNTPLYLEHFSGIHSNPINAIQSEHYSHSSHESHYSHYSHYSSR